MSEKTWEQYNCGDGEFVTIKPHSEFEVSEKASRLLLRNLGSEKWIVRAEDALKRPPRFEGMAEPQSSPEALNELKKAVGEEKQPFCLGCESKGVKHKKNCIFKI